MHVHFCLRRWQNGANTSIKYQRQDKYTNLKENNEIFLQNFLQKDATQPRESLEKWAKMACRGHEG